MGQDTLRFLLREAVRETVTEVPQTVLEEMLQAVEAFRRRPLPEEMAFVYLDGLYLKLLRGAAGPGLRAPAGGEPGGGS